MRNITPTPWRIGAIESGMVAIDGANGEEVTGFVSPEDGRLIAAAPDLLEALIELADTGAEAWGKDRPCVRWAYTAIAKATGGSND